MADKTLADKIIHMIFEETGERFTKDEPMLGLIIAQHRLLDDKLQQLEDGIQDYSRLIKQGQDNLNISLKTLQTYREDILNDLAAETKRQSDTLVGDALKEYGSVLLSSHVSRIQSMIVTMNKGIVAKLRIIQYQILLVIVLVFVFAWVL